MQQYVKPSNLLDSPLNGGLFTGTPFIKGAPWGNIPVIPDAGYMTHFNLQSALPPKDALVQYPGGLRLGNNNPSMPGLPVLPLLPLLPVQTPNALDLKPMSSPEPWSCRESKTQYAAW